VYIRRVSRPVALEGGLGLALAFGPLVGTTIGESRRFRGDGARTLRDRSFVELQALQVAGLVGAVVAGRALPALTLPGGYVWPIAGLVLGLAGAALRAWSIRTLGAGFTRELRVSAEQPLVRAGPYRLLRHPSYSGAILLVGGVGVAIGNAASIALAVGCVTVAYVRRIAVEERLLRGRFGAAWDAHVAATDRLVPGVW
jgi:protein-S-isoprenylcysteine O-methyltransferase